MISDVEKMFSRYDKTFSAKTFLLAQELFPCALRKNYCCDNKYRKLRKKFVPSLHQEEMLLATAIISVGVTVGSNFNASTSNIYNGEKSTRRLTAY